MERKKKNLKSCGPDGPPIRDARMGGRDTASILTQISPLVSPSGADITSGFQYDGV